jgi:hypothetical protein
MHPPSFFENAPEGHLSEAAAQALLAGHAYRFSSEVWRDAWAEYSSLPDGFRGQLRAVTQANILHDLAVTRAKRIFADVPNAEWDEDLGFFKLYISGPTGDAAVIRLKRLDSEHLARNIETEQQCNYYAHKHMEGVRDGYTRLTVGYTMNRPQTDMAEIVTSLQYGREYLIYSFVLDAEPNVQQFPAAPLPPDAKPPVRLKGRKPEKGTGNG